MNVIRVYGGLGNQLFQYALGQVQKSNGIEVCYHIDWYKKEENSNRPYCLDKFNTKVIQGHFLKQKTLNEVVLHYMDDMLFTRLCHFNFFGYWQHPRYYEAILPQLKREFTVREELYTEEYLRLKDEIINTESVSLHVRRGDYIKINGHHLLPLQYYKEALKLVKGKLYIFSDDIPWCKQNFKDATYVDLESYLSFELMKLCSHNIIANSTFSWWAAYLNSNPNKIVVSPEQWRVSKKEQELMSKDLNSPQGWKIIGLPTDWNGK